MREYFWPYTVSVHMNNGYVFCLMLLLKPLTYKPSYRCTTRPGFLETNLSQNSDLSLRFYSNLRNLKKCISRKKLSTNFNST